MNNGNLELYADIPVKAENAGLFISRGYGRHPERIIDSYELIFVRSGRLEIFEENMEYCVEEGEVLILYPGLKHGGLKPYPPDLSFFWVHFYLKQPSTSAGMQIAIPKLSKITRPAIFTEVLHRFLDDQEQGYNSPFSFNLYLMNILCEIHNSAILFRPDIKPNMLAEAADKYILTNFHQKLSTSMIANAVGCNADYLGRIYLDTFGTTITEAIHKKRIRHACRQLLESSRNIDEVARNSGYDDPAYFRRVFKKQKGMSPLKFRNLYCMMHTNTE